MAGFFDFSFFNNDSSAATTTAESAPAATEPAAPQADELDVFAEAVQQSRKPAEQAAAKDYVAVLAENDEGVTALASGKSFLDSLPDEVQQGLDSADPAAIKAAIAHAGRSAYKAAMRDLSQVQVADRDRQAAELDRLVEARLRARDEASAMEAAMPSGAHPATRFVMESIVSQLRAANPDASMKALAEQAKRIMGKVSGNLAPPPAETKHKRSLDAFFDDI